MFSQYNTMVQLFVSSVFTTKVDRNSKGQIAN